jgi:hypothetical protein
MKSMTVPTNTARTAALSRKPLASQRITPKPLIIRI